MAHAETEKKLQFNRKASNYQYEILFVLNRYPNAKQQGVIYCFANKTAPQPSIDLCKSFGNELKGYDGHYRYLIQ